MNKAKTTIEVQGQTAKQWRDAHPAAEDNLRDHVPLEQLVVLTNLESLKPVLIRQGLPQSARLLKLNEIAITQMRTLPGQLFYSTQIPVCLWFFWKNAPADKCRALSELELALAA
jgi:hypothetical protein